MSLRSLSIFAFAVILGLSNQVAAVGFQPPSPDELKMTSEPQAPGAAAIMLYRQVDRDDNGRTSRRQLLSHQDPERRWPQVRRCGNTLFPSEGIIVIHIHARTIRPDGSIAGLRRQSIRQTIAKARGLKYSAKTFTLTDVQVGSIIEYSFTSTFRNFLLRFKLDS